MTNFAVLKKKAVTQAGIAVSEMKRETDKTVFGSASPFFLPRGTCETADRSAQLVECRITVREVVGSNPGRTNIWVFLITE